MPGRAVSGRERVRNRSESSPGYPLFLATVFAVWRLPESREHAVWVLQSFMAVAAYCLVYAAIRPRSRTAALLAFLLLLSASCVTQFSAGTISETLTTFLMAVLVFQVSRIEIGVATRLTVLSIGVLCVAVLLTAAATMFLALMIWLYQRVEIARRPSGASYCW